MRALRLSLAGTLILALLGGLSGAVVAQDDEGSGTFTIESTEDLGEFDFDASGNAIITMSKEASDPRMSGTWTEVWGCQQGSGIETCVASVLVENEGGTWLGRANGFGSPSGVYDMTVFDGQGGYEGLTALRVVITTPTGEVEEGVILDFEMPEQPELPAE